MERKKYTEQDCFRIWVNLGDKRSIEEVAEITGKSPKTVYNYSSSGKWKDKLATLAEEDKKVIQALVNDNSNIVRLIESEVYTGLSDKLLEVIKESLELLEPTKSIKDLKTLVDIQRLISGKPTEISQVQTSIEVDLTALSDEELEILEKIPQA